MVNLSYGYDVKSELLYLTPLWMFSDEVSARVVVVFVRSGNVNLPGVSGATFRNAGINGYGWSSRASSTRYDGSAIPSAYNLEFNASAVNPSNGPNERWHSFPLRCLFMCRGGCRSFLYFIIKLNKRQIMVCPIGVEPTTPSSGSWCSIH